MKKLTDFWCFRLAALARKISRAYNSLCTEHGVTAVQSFVLFDLLENEGSSVKDIASRVKLDSPAVTGIIDRLLKEELVVRKEDPNDRRSLQICLTSKGRKLADELLPLAEEFGHSLKDGFQLQEVKEFEDLLFRLEEKF
ncbi:MAG: MarR family transcriptional regulator [Syntrophomonadaceae bacterium]|nr:MarR family transcriptional regulator [Syntrophomonadaceae bacterium]